MADVLIYTKPFCPYCSRALALLRSKNVAFTEVDDAAFNLGPKNVPAEEA